MKSGSAILSALGALPFVSLVSCVTTYEYPKDYTGPSAMIRSTTLDNTGVKGKGFYVSNVDGKSSPSPMSTPRGGGMFVRMEDVEVKVPARATTIKLTGATLYAADGAALVDSIAGGDRYVSGVLAFTPKPGGEYRVTGDLTTKGKESVWLEELKTGKIVGEKITK